MRKYSWTSGCLTRRRATPMSGLALIDSLAHSDNPVASLVGTLEATSRPFGPDTVMPPFGKLLTDEERVLIAEYIATLTRTLLTDARLEALGISAEPPDTTHLFGLRLPSEIDPKRVEAQLKQLGVHVSVRGWLVRVSPHVYNDIEDAEALIGALEVALDAG